MTTNKTLLLSAAAVTILGGMLLSTNQVSAHGAWAGDGQDTLAQRIADKFGLKPDQVKTVLQEVRAEHQAEHRAEFEAHLSQLVSEGKITQAQQQLILAKHAELVANRSAHLESLKNMTPVERKAAMETHRQTLKAWAEQNGIDPQYMMFMKHRGQAK